MASTKARNGRAAQGNGEATTPAEEVARMAYQLFEQRGGTHGRDQQDWFEAERIVRSKHRARSGQ